MTSTYVDVRYATNAPPISDVDLACASTSPVPGGDEDTAPSGVSELARGRYLCEVCEDVMTDGVLPAAQSLTGVEIAICPTCRLKRGR